MSTPIITIPQSILKAFCWIQKKGREIPKYQGIHSGKGLIPYCYGSSEISCFFLEVASPYYAARWYNPNLEFSLNPNERYITRLIEKTRKTVTLSFTIAPDLPQPFPDTSGFYPSLSLSDFKVTLHSHGTDMSGIAVSLYYQTQKVFPSAFLRLLKTQPKWVGTVVNPGGHLLLTLDEGFHFWIAAMPLSFKLN